MPSWSPSGTQIIHIRYLVGVTSSEIFVMDTSGANPIRLTINNIKDAYPKYSPDVKSLAFNSKQDSGVLQVWVMNVDGTNCIQLTTYGGEKPAWSPEGKIIYVHYNYRKFNANNGTLWVMDADGGNKYQLTFNYGLIL